MHSTVEGLLDSIHWWLIYFCDFLFPLLKDMCISHHALVHGSKWPSSLGNPAPLHLHGDQLSSREAPTSQLSARGARGGWGGAAATGGPKTPHQVQPWQGRGPELSWGHSTDSHGHSSLISHLHVDSAHLLFWAGALVFLEAK